MLLVFDYVLNLAAERVFVEIAVSVLLAAVAAAVTIALLLISVLVVDVTVALVLLAAGADAVAPFLLAAVVVVCPTSLTGMNDTLFATGDRDCVRSA